MGPLSFSGRRITQRIPQKLGPVDPEDIGLHRNDPGKAYSRIYATHLYESSHL